MFESPIEILKFHFALLGNSSLAVTVTFMKLTETFLDSRSSNEVLSFPA